MRTKGRPIFNYREEDYFPKPTRQQLYNAPCAIVVCGNTHLCRNTKQVWTGFLNPTFGKFRKFQKSEVYGYSYFFILIGEEIQGNMY